MNDVRETINTMLVKTFHEILELEEKAGSEKPFRLQLCKHKVKNFPCEHPFLRKLCYNSFDDLPLYAVIPVTICF